MLCGARLLAASSVMAGVSAHAQAVGQSLPSREQIELPEISDLRPVNQVRVDAQLAVSPCPFATSGLSADLRQLRFAQPDGSAIPPELADTLARVRVSPGSQPVSNLCTVRDQANQALYDAGYVAHVQIPPQEITAGEALLHVVLARLVAVDVTGNAGPYQGTLQARIAQ